MKLVRNLLAACAAVLALGATAQASTFAAKPQADKLQVGASFAVITQNFNVGVKQVAPILKAGLARAASPGVNEYGVAKIRLSTSEMVGMAGKTKYGNLGVQTVAKAGGSYIANGTYIARVTQQSGMLFALSAAAKVTSTA